MATNAAIGYGAVMAYGDGASPEVFTTFAEVTSITPPAAQIDIIDVTHMASPGTAREFIAGLIDYGEASFEINLIPGTGADSAIRSQFAARTTKNYRISFPDSPATTEVFAAFVTGYERNVPVDDRMTATITLKVTGPSTVS